MSDSEEAAQLKMLAKLSDLEAATVRLPSPEPTDPLTASEREEVLGMIARMRELAAKVKAATK